MGFLRGLLSALGFIGFTGNIVAQDLGSMSAIYREALDYQGLGRIAELRQQAANDRVRMAERFLSGNPSVTLSQKTDQWNQNLGEREDAIGLSLPLWRWGEREAATQASRMGAKLAEREAQIDQYALAGQVREAVWRYILEHLRLQQLEIQLEEAQKTERDAKRRYELGDIAKIDWFNARIAVQNILTGLAEQKSQRSQAERLLVQVTGKTGSQLGLTFKHDAYPILLGRLAERLPEAEEKSAALEEAPEYQLLLTRLRLNNHRLQIVQAQGSGHPELSIESARSRGVSGEPFVQTVTVSIALPFGGQSQEREALAQITLERERNQQALRQFEKTFGFFWQTGLAEIEEKLRVRALANKSLSDAQAIREALQKAADAGELAYVERLRAERQAFDAQVAAIEADVNVQQTISGFLQGIGRLPDGVTH